MSVAYNRDEGTTLATPAQEVANLWIRETDVNGFVLSAYCTGTPPTTANKFQAGCEMIRTDGSSSNVWYVNTGTIASPSWTSLGSIPPGDIPLASADLLVGSSGGVAAPVALSGDATITNAGVITVGAGAITDAKAASTSAIGPGLMRMAHAIYSFAVDGGAVSTITPVSTAAIPQYAVIIGGTINSTTAVTSGGSATVAVGTSAGSSTTSILGATGKASFTTDALINSAATLASPVKMSAAGNITITVATAALTAGIIEIFVLYYVAANA